ncbi:MAG TPA: hypothetical protein VFN26_06730 [Candidatus Acidoferrum sp.]|nr:hypothetical protein [Candidatus Acidoferrum sp.]
MFLLTSEFEFGSELAAAVDLQGSPRERKTLPQRIEEAGGGQRSGTAMHFDDIPARDHVSRAEVH